MRIVAAIAAALLSLSAHAVDVVCTGVAPDEGGSFTLDCQLRADCQGEWSDWSTTTVGECVDGERELAQARAFTITQDPAAGGEACPPSPEQRTLTETCEVATDVGSLVSVSENRRYLELDGQPWMPVVDTAWRACRALDDAGITEYLEQRAAQGFNAIQGCIPVFNPLYSGGFSIVDSWSPVTLSTEFWARNDHFVAEATRLGLVVIQPIMWGVARQYVEDVDGYVRAVVERYADNRNVIYLAVGEYHKATWEGDPPDRDLRHPWGQADYDFVYSAGEAADRYARSDALVMLHPDGGASPKEHFANAPWLDAYLFQGYLSGRNNVQLTAADYASPPTIPFWQGEIFYLDNPNGVSNRFDEATPANVRAAAYQGWMLGGAGFTHGHWSVWQFADDWRAAMSHESAAQIGTIFHEFTAEHHANDNRPAQELINSPGRPADFETYQTALRTPNGAVLYSPRGENLSVNVGQLGATGLTYRWVNPRTGATTTAQTVAQQAAVTFNPPGAPADDNDYLLVLSYADTPPASGGGDVGSFTVYWQWPETNVDGTALREPLVAEIIYGSSTGQYDSSVVTPGVELPDGRRTHTVSGVAAGRYYIAIRARDADGLVSVYSNEVTTTVQGESPGMALTTDLVHQADVNTRGRTDDAPYDHINDVVATNVNGPTVTGSGDDQGMSYAGDPTEQVSTMAVPTFINNTTWLDDEPWTIAFNAQWDAVGSGDDIFGLYSSNSFTAAVRFIGDDANNTDFYISDGDATIATRYIRGTTNVSSGRNVYVATHDGAGQMRFYVNGVEQNTGAVVPAAWNLAQILDELSWGANTRSNQIVVESDSKVYWSAIWSRALTTEEIESLDDVNNPFLSTVEPGLRAQWDVNTRGRTDNTFYDHVTGAVVDTSTDLTVQAGDGGYSGMLFNGSTSAATVSTWPMDLSQSFADSDFTMAARFTADDKTVYRNIFGVGSTADARRIHLLTLITSGNEAGAFEIATGTDSYLNGSADVSGASEYVLVMRRSSGVFTLWLDGVQVDTDSTAVGAAGSSDRIHIGSAFGPAYINPLSGRVMWAAIYDKALSDAEIQALDDSANPFIDTTTLAVDAADHSQSADALTLTPGDVLALNDAEHSQSADAPTLAPGDVLALSDAAHGQSADAPTLTPGNVLSASDADHNQSVDVLALAPGDVLAASNADHSQSADAPTLAPGDVLAPSDADHSQSADTPTLSPADTLNVADADHSQNADNIVLVLANAIGIEGAAHSQLAESVTISPAYALAVADALHTQSVDGAALTPGFALTVAEALHAQAADNALLDAGTVLAAASATHGHTADTPALMPAILLTPDAAQHAQNADVPVIAVGHVLATDSAAHAQLADALDLTSAYVLTLDEATHAQLADAIALAQDTQIVVAGATHGQTADNIIFVGTIFYSERVLLVGGADRVIDVQDIDRIVKVTG